METQKGWVEDLSKGKGGLRYYRYFANCVQLYTKSAIVEGIDLGVSNIVRVDKVTGKKEKFNYNKLKFEDETR